MKPITVFLTGLCCILVAGGIYSVVEMIGDKGEEGRVVITVPINPDRSVGGQEPRGPIAR